MRRRFDDRLEKFKRAIGVSEAGAETPPWELVKLELSEVHEDATERLKVPGGWLYRCTYCDIDGDGLRDVVFVPFSEKEGGA